MDNRNKGMFNGQAEQMLQNGSHKHLGTNCDFRKQVWHKQLQLHYSLFNDQQSCFKIYFYFILDLNIIPCTVEDIPI